MNFRLITLFVAFTALTISCDTDEFLTQVNPNELSTGSFWKTNNDLQMGQVAVYNAFKNTNILNIIAETNRSDLSWPGFGRPNTNNRFVQYYQHTFNDSSNEINVKWEALYTLIFRSNQVIVNGQRLIESYTSETAIEEATITVAQARFLRGLAYSYLYYTYNNGSVPLIDFVPNGEEEFYQPLAPASDVKSLFIADFEFAYANLPATWDSDLDKGRVTAAAAAAELGRSYLYDKDYEMADVYFSDIIENADYGLALVENIGDNFNEAGELNAESILEVNYATAFKTEENAGTTENVASNNARTFAPGSHGGYRTLVPSAWIIMAYKQEKLDTSDARNYIDCDSATDPDCDATGKKLRKYSLRASHSIALVDEDATPYYGPHLPGQVSPFNGSEPAYYRKYTNWENTEDERDFVPLGRSPINNRLVRLADVYLMKAECLIKGGSDESGVQQATALINEIRKRSALELIGPSASSRYPGSDHDEETYDAQSLMEHLMYVERPLELSVEGHATRFLDLRRWGVIKERFQDLSTRVYWADHHWNIDTYSSNNAAPKTATRWQSVLIEGKPWEPVAPKAANGNDMDYDATGSGNSFKNGNYTKFIDYEAAASNYIESVHGYYPIPNKEVTANPNL